jgi:photosystem II stability/assembly factor-like uncharacterized protein
MNGFIGGMKNSANQVLLKTVDNGTTWTEITPDPASTDVISAIYFITPSSGFAASASMLYTTTNGGATWTAQPTTFAIHSIHFTNMNNGTVTGTTNVTNEAVMMRTTDGGQTWSTLLSATDPNTFVNSFGKQDVIGSSVMYTSLENTNKLFRTADGGTTWDTIVCDSVYNILDFQFTTPLLGHVLSDYGQIFVTEDGGLTWALEYATEWGFYGPSIYLYSLSFVEEVGYVVGTSGLIKRHDATTSIGEQSSVSDLNIYPNPLNTAQELVIETTGTPGEVEVQIVNAIGQVVLSKRIIATQNNRVTLAGLNLPAGIYSVSVEMNEIKNTKKLMIVD